MSDHRSRERRVGRWASVVAAVCGTLILVGTVLTLEPWPDVRGLLAAGFGLFFLVLGLWYHPSPALRDERTDRRYRREVERLERLVRLLHRAARRQDFGAFERVRQRMQVSVERLAETAWPAPVGEERPGSPADEEVPASRSGSRAPAEVNAG